MYIDFKKLEKRGFHVQLTNDADGVHIEAKRILTTDEFNNVSKLFELNNYSTEELVIFAHRLQVVEALKNL